MLARSRAIAFAIAVVSFALSTPARADDSWFDDSATSDSAPQNDATPPDAPAVPNDSAPPNDGSPPPRGLAGVRHASDSTAASTSGTVDPEDADPGAVQRFRPTLAPYGHWVEDSNYGLVWVPNSGIVGEHFAPYVTSGHWELDTYGEWVWVSDYPFGEVVFHYGRWVWIDSVGWAWIPGNRYAAAWVVWREPVGDYAYVGWAPAPVTFVWIGGTAVYCGWYHPVGYVYVSSYYAFSHEPARYIVRDPAIRHRLAVQTRRIPANPTLAQAHVPPQAAPIHRRPAFIAPTRTPLGQSGPTYSRSVRLPATRSAPITHTAPVWRNESRDVRAPALRSPSMGSAQRVSPVWRSPAVTPREPPLPVYRGSPSNGSRVVNPPLRSTIPSTPSGSSSRVKTRRH